MPSGRQLSQPSEWVFLFLVIGLFAVLYRRELKTVVNRLASPPPAGQSLPCSSSPSLPHWPQAGGSCSEGFGRGAIEAHAEATRGEREGGAGAFMGQSERLYAGKRPIPRARPLPAQVGPGARWNRAGALPVANPGRVFMEIVAAILPYPCFRHHIAAYVDCPTRASPSSCLRRCLRK